MDFNYKKNDNQKLFNKLQENNLLNISNCQNYNPLYEKFFELNEKNYNNITLNNEYYLHNILEKESDNIFKAVLFNINSNSKRKEKVFFKYGPLLDPIKYLIGKYDVNDSNLLNLPQPSFKNNLESSSIICHKKVKDANNSAYVDSFFTYLTSQMLHKAGFIHGLDFYGSFLAIKKNFVIDIADDYEYLIESDFFNKHKQTLFSFDEDYASNFLPDNNNTRDKKQKIIIEHIADNKNNIDDNIIIEFDNINELDKFNSIIITNDTTNCSADNNINDITSSFIIDEETKEQIIENVNNENNENNSDSESDCSSRCSLTDEENDNDNDEPMEICDETVVNINASEVDASEVDASAVDASAVDASAVDENEVDSSDNSDYEDYDENSSESDYVEEKLNLTINNFPVQAIALECCDGTLDSLITEAEEDLLDEEWDSIVIQILMMLITYQKCFNLTHNDLHSNNIMYKHTDIKYLYYKVDNKFYKVPTFGKLLKIIDFGRAIYKFRGITMCSDSYNKTGDAAGLYNIEPYFNVKKSRLEPNYSFDLCRLSCSLYDLFVEDISEQEEVEKTSPIIKIILDWCNDDNGKNILYKKNGEERYPDFKLYKMIARLVHNHIPLNVLRNPYFEKYVISKKSIKSKDNIMNIDDYSVYI